MAEASSRTPTTPIGALLLEHRLQADLTQEALAERAGLGVRSIQAIESGENNPRRETVDRLARALGLAGDRQAELESLAQPTPRVRRAGRLRLARDGALVEHPDSSYPSDGAVADGRGTGQLSISSPFTPSRSLPGNLPVQLTSFVGREREIAEVKRLLGTARLLTLTGTGGCGKTRLAYQVAADLLDRYSDGVWLVELAPLADPGLVSRSVAFALGVHEQPGQPILDALVGFLKSRHVLLVLDNCEHLLEASAALADSLLRRCPDLKLLATSREALGIGGESSYRVPSLSLPDSGRPQSLESLRQSEAVQLFIGRATAVQPEFRLSERNADAVAQVCLRLDGIPLAIELAAARVRGLSVEQIPGRLDNRFRLLTGGSRTALRRQQTLRATIDWSHDLLPEPEKVVFRRLSVFVGGWDLDTAEAVCGSGIESHEVVDSLLRLVDRSLVVAVTEPEPTRYYLNETLRQYALERLSESGEATSVRDRHLDWYLAFGEQGATELSRRDQRAWLERLESEWGNLRSAHDWSLARGGDAEPALRLATVLARAGDRGGRVSEGIERLESALGRSGGSIESRVTALQTLGEAASHGGEWRRARVVYRESLGLAEKTGDKGLIARAVLGLSWVHSDLGERAEARALQEEALRLSRETGDGRQVLGVLHHLALTAYLQGDDASALTLAEEGAATARELGNWSVSAINLGILGSVALWEGNLERARAVAEEGLTHARVGGSGLTAAWCLLLLGHVARAEKDYAAAEAFYRDALTPYRRWTATGDWFRATLFLVSLAGLWVARGRALEAARLYGAVHGWLDARGMPVPFLPPRGYEQDEEACRSTLGQARAAGAYAEGQAMTLEQAVEYALKAEE